MSSSNWWIRFKMRIRMHIHVDKSITRRANVEQLLFDIARNKHPPLTADQCFQLALYLGSLDKKKMLEKDPKVS